MAFYVNRTRCYNAAIVQFNCWMQQGVSEISLEEINKEIAAVREEKEQAQA